MLGEKIKSLREEKKLTQQELADAINLSQATIGMIESGKKTGSPATLKKISDFFGVTMNYLLSETDINTDENIKKEDKVDSDIVRIERARNKMPQEDKENMMRVLEAAFGKYFKD